jgi:hypothetical protein
MKPNQLFPIVLLAVASAVSTGCQGTDRPPSRDASPLQISAVNEFLSSQPSKREVEDHFGHCDGLIEENSKSSNCIYVVRMSPLLSEALYVPVGFKVCFTNDVVDRWTIIFGNEGATSKPVSSGGIVNGALEMHLVGTNFIAHARSCILEIPNAVIQTVQFQGESLGSLAIEVRQGHLEQFVDYLRAYQGQRASIYIDGDLIGYIRLNPDSVQGNKMQARFESS